MSKTALICVDVQRDFISGSLGGEGRVDVIAPLVALAQSPDVDLVVASRDWHPADHCSFAKGEPEFRDGSWPVHCVQGSSGASLAASIQEYADVIVDKGTDPAKEAYSAFEGRVRFGGTDIGLGTFLHTLGVRRVIVGGLCTDYCVKATALEARRLAFETIVQVDACAAVTPETGAEALRELADAGVTLGGFDDSR